MPQYNIISCGGGTITSTGRNMLKTRYIVTTLMQLAAVLALIPASSPSHAGLVKVWLTEGNAGTIRMEPQKNISPLSGNGKNQYIIKIDPSVKYQTITGFGGTLTEASAHLIYNSPKRNMIMEKLFSREKGIGISFIRLTVGACDHSLADYNYQNSETGTFSLQHDEKEIIPLVLQALSLNPDLTIMATPWSPPGWMKQDYLDTARAMRGGMLKWGYSRKWAEYLADYVKGMAAHGITIDYLTPQNEPYNSTKDYPSMNMGKNKALVHLPLLAKVWAERKLSTKILVYDHNLNAEGAGFVRAMFDDPDIGPFMAGSAWHNYDGYPGDFSIMDSIGTEYPKKEVHFTERTGQKQDWWGDTFDYLLFTNAKHILDAGASSVLFWNIALDENGGPMVNGAKGYNGTGFVTVQSDYTAYHVNPDYSAVGHYSRIALPGAVKIGSTDFAGSSGFQGAYTHGVYSEAFKNPDGSIGIMVYNRYLEEKRVSVQLGNSYWDCTLPPISAYSFLHTDQTVSAHGRKQDISHHSAAVFLKQTVKGWQIAFPAPVTGEVTFTLYTLAGKKIAMKKVAVNNAEKVYVTDAKAMVSNNLVIARVTCTDRTFGYQRTEQLLRPLR